MLQNMKCTQGQIGKNHLRWEIRQELDQVGYGNRFLVTPPTQRTGEPLRDLQDHNVLRPHLTSQASRLDCLNLLQSASASPLPYAIWQTMGTNARTIFPVKHIIHKAQHYLLMQIMKCQMCVCVQKEKHEEKVYLKDSINGIKEFPCQYCRM